MTCEVDRDCTALSLASIKRVAEQVGIEVELFPAWEKEPGSRGKSIHGPRAVGELISWYQSLAADFDWVLKIDSETLMLGTSWLSRLDGPWRLVGGGDQIKDRYRYIRGHAYFVRPETFAGLPSKGEDLEYLMRCVDHYCGDYVSRPNRPEYGWPEDEVISGIVRYCFGDDAMCGLPLNGDVPYLGFWPFERHGVDECTLSEVQAVAARHDFIEFGRWGKYRPDLKKRSDRRRALVAPAMNHFYSILKNDES